MSMKTILPNKPLHERYYDGAFEVENFRESFETQVNKLISTLTPDKVPPDLQWRIYATDSLISAYVNQTGETPEGRHVNRLANWLLFESLADRHPDKVTREEFPIMTKRQLKTRYSRETADESIPETHTEQNYLGGKKQANYNKSE
ncbi:hypothetical protein CHL76_02385 [Marinococcus halophilus]|uniref:Uncharacterized protein n=1 Tax=Marinococcus halophilus TaxID=1371 RepID=A0A510Y1G9_MARHA|nr:hypothetical protein [Marinococcus halophilus]OZT81223.1 hypothetical protein CHL76_02385 [Marinococcus halophilus]GEK57162.1 hypothetical protein MHA01_00670 [Marinococcus halophilus]